MNNFEKTTELEQEFFKVFGIEPTIIDACKITDEYWNNEELADKYGCFALYMREKCPYDEDCRDNCEYAFDKIEYPEITDHKLLEIICILGNGKDGSKNLNLYTANEDEWFAVLKDQYNSAYCAAIDNDFKNAVLKLCIYRADIEDFKHQIQQLFKEDE